MLGLSQSILDLCQDLGSDLPKKGFWAVNVTCSRSERGGRLRIAKSKSPTPILGVGVSEECGVVAPWENSPVVTLLFRPKVPGDNDHSARM